MKLFIKFYKKVKIELKEYIHKNKIKVSTIRFSNS